MQPQWVANAMSLSQVLHSSHTPQVAIIGAGAGGSSAAYQLAKLAPSAQITVYDANDYVGGRSTTVDIGGTAVELGASIFVEVNQHLISFAKLFNLTLEDPRARLTAKNESSAGIFDGQQWRWKESNPASKSALARLLWRYGLSPYRATRHVSAIINQFVNIYDAGPFDSTTKLIGRLGLLDETRQTAAQSYAAAGVSAKFQEDIIQAATRVNYAQGLQMHGVLGCVAFVTNSPSYAVEGGNWRIFDALLKHSNATVKLRTRVAAVTRFNSSWIVDAHGHNGQGVSRAFDYVLIATPLGLSNITLSPQISPPLQEVDYVELHVSLITTWQRPSVKRFGSDPPAGILTTVPDGRNMSLLSFSAVSKAKSGEYIYKVFSFELVTPAFLTTLFDEHISEDKVFRHVWRPYPKSEPTDVFDQVEVQHNLFYANSFERWISTMETASIAGINSASLIARKIALS